MATKGGSGFDLPGQPAARTRVRVPQLPRGLFDLHSGFSLAHAPQRVRPGEVPAIPGRGPFHRSEAGYPWLRCVDLPLYEWYQSWGQVTWLTEAGFRGVTVSPLDPPMPHWLAEAHKA